MFSDIITIIGQGLGSATGHRLGWGLWDLLGAPAPPAPSEEEVSIRYHTRYVVNRIRYAPNRHYNIERNPRFIESRNRIE